MLDRKDDKKSSKKKRKKFFFSLFTLLYKNYLRQHHTMRAIIKITKVIVLTIELNIKRPCGSVRLAVTFDAFERTSIHGPQLITGYNMLTTISTYKARTVIVKFSTAKSIKNKKLEQNRR